jgi:hypothetical protein
MQNLYREFILLKESILENSKMLSLYDSLLKTTCYEWDVVNYLTQFSPNFFI